MTDTSPPTIYSVAREAGVSIATVSRVLRSNEGVRPSTRARVQEAAARLGYVPSASARGLAVQRTEAVGLVVPRLSGPYYAELLLGFADAAAGFGQSVVLHLAGGEADPWAAVRELAGRVDGLAFLARSAADDALVASTVSVRPVVTVARDAVPGADCLLAENEESSEHLAQHLLEHGYRRFAYLGDPDRSPDIRGRYAGFAGALDRAGIVPPAATPIAQREDAARAHARSHLAELAAADAIVCANDEVALATAGELGRAGVAVPGDVALVGWDDIMAGRYATPGLTTVRQPVAELGALAAVRLHTRIGGASAQAEPTVLPTRPIWRASCGCSPALTTQ